MVFEAEHKKISNKIIARSLCERNLNQQVPLDQIHQLVHFRQIAIELGVSVRSRENAARMFRRRFVNIYKSSEHPTEKGLKTMFMDLVEESTPEPLPEPIISNTNSTKSPTKSTSNEIQTRWGDLLKENYKPKSGMASNTASRLSNFSPNCQSTPIKEQDARNNWDEEDLMADNLTLTGPEITVSNMTGSHVPLPNQTVLSESLMSFLKHEEEAKATP